MPYVNAESSSPGLTKRGFKWFFRTCPHDGPSAWWMFEFTKELEKRRGIKNKTVGLMHENTPSAKVRAELAVKHG